MLVILHFGLSRFGRNGTVKNNFFPGTARQGRCAANRFAQIFANWLKKSVRRTASLV